MLATALCGAAAWSDGAWAAEKPVYAPPAAWVKPATIPDRPQATDGSPIQTLLIDEQSLLGANGDELYSETAYRVLTPQGLGPSGSVVLTWRPDTETLTIHRAHLIRDGKVIDLLADGKTFTVLRRETNLEMAMLDGTLTATLQPEGLQVGDIVDLSTTLQRRDPVLQGFSEDYDHLAHAGAAARVRFRDVWPDAKPMRWRVTEGVTAPQVIHKDGQTEATIDMADVTTPKPPIGAPGRFQQLGELEVSQFADWAQLSGLMAPLYKTASKLAPDSPLRAEVAKIAAASADPKVRTTAALKLVQEQVRYLFLGMNEGGYVPADADTTWARRFGDCKAKTALLLALLNELGIDAQPVMANGYGADGLDQRLPMLRAFNHVLVRASIGGKVYWLDGTRTGDRNLDDIRTPPFDWVLPVQPTGATLVKLERQQLAEPGIESSLTIDASKGFEAKATVRMQMDYRGEDGLSMHQQMSAVPTADSQRYLREYWTKLYPWLDVSDVGSSFDEAKGVERLTMSGSGAMEWTATDGGGRYYRAPNTTTGYEANFKREPGPNQDAPFALIYPLYIRAKTTINLPNVDHGGFILLGGDVDATLAGMRVERTSRLDGSTITIVLSQQAQQREVSAAQAQGDAARLREMGRTGVSIVYDPTASHTAPSGRAATGASDLLAAAQTGRASAQRDLGKAYAKGANVPMDLPQARIWLRKAADQGDQEAEIALAEMYAQGYGGEKDDAQAFALFAKAAAAGNVQAQEDMGYAYEHGRGVAADVPTAIGWYRKAADHNLISAELALGMIYCCNTASKDDAESVRWFRKAADQGDPTAQDNLAIMYRTGRGVPADPDEARRLWERAAAQGDARGENALGVIYNAGTGVPMQTALAAFYFRKAADQGLAEAQYNLGNAYLSGAALAKNGAQAAYWYQKAAAQGDAKAKRQLDQLGQTGVVPASAPIEAPTAPAPLPPIPRLTLDPAVLDARGQELAAGGDIDSALKAFDQAVGLRPDVAAYRLDRARALLRKGQDDKALADIGQAISLAPNTSAAYLLRGGIYARTGRQAQAIDDYTAAASHAPTDPETLKGRAEVYAVMGRYPLALADLTRAIALAPKRADLLEERSQTYRLQSNLVAAKADMDAAIALQPSAVAYFLRSSLHGPAGAAAARADLDAAVRLKPDYSAALEARAMLSVQAGDLTQAAQDFDAGLKTAGDQTAFIEREAIAYESAGRYEPAVRSFDALIARRPGNARDLSNRCWTKAAWGQQLQSALSDCDAALALTPSDGMALYNRGFVLLRLGQFDQAIATLTTAAQTGPKVAASLYWRGVAKHRKGQTGDGDGDLAAAKAIDPQVTAALARYGVAP